MRLYLRILIFIFSLAILFAIVFLAYKRGKRKNIKKALFRTAYISISAIIAFVVAPFLNDFLLNFDLYSIGRSIEYNGLKFYRLIDFIEEIIVHNEFLNDVYNLMPSLKTLLLDFPQVLFVPITYLIVFLSTLLLLLPLYLYISYKRKRKVLYNVVSSKQSTRYWAGVISAIQAVFIIAIVLTPINGLSKVYRDSKAGLIDSESNVCEQNEITAQYSFACSIVEAYNSSIFSFLGEMPTNNYVYGALTRIKYQDKSSSLNQEIVSVARAAVVLNKTGLLKAGEISDFKDVTNLNFTGLTESDIDIVVTAFEKSLYTQDIVLDVYEWSKEYLKWLLKDWIEDSSAFEYKYEDIVGELKIILRAINYIVNDSHLLTDIEKVYRHIQNYIDEYEVSYNEYVNLQLFYNVLYSIDINEVRELFLILKDTKTYNNFMPPILTYGAKYLKMRTAFVNDKEGINQLILYSLDVLEMMKKYNTHYIYDFFYNLTDADIRYLAEIASYVMSREELADLAKDLIDYGLSIAHFSISFPVDIIYDIEDWYKELKLAHLVYQIAYEGVFKGTIDYDKAWYGLTHYSDTVLFKAAWNYAIGMLPDVFTMWICGKGYKYLVGYYVSF